MSFTEEFAQAWRHQRTLMKHRPDRLRVRMLIYLLWLAGFGFFFAVIHIHCCIAEVQPAHKRNVAQPRVVDSSFL